MTEDKRWQIAEDYWMLQNVRNMSQEELELRNYLHRISIELYGKWVGRLFYKLLMHGVRSFDDLRDIPLEEISKWKSIGPQALKLAQVAKERLSSAEQ